MVMQIKLVVVVICECSITLGERRWPVRALHFCEKFKHVTVDDNPAGIRWINSDLIGLTSEIIL